MTYWYFNRAVFTTTFLFVVTLCSIQSSKSVEAFLLLQQECFSSSMMVVRTTQNHHRWSNSGHEAGHRSGLPQMYQRQQAIISMRRKRKSNDYFGVSHETSWFQHQTQLYTTTRGNDEQLSQTHDSNNVIITDTSPDNITNNYKNLCTNRQSSLDEKKSVSENISLNNNNNNNCHSYDFFDEYESTIRDVLQSQRVIRGTKGMTEEDNGRVSDILLSHFPTLTVSTSFVSNEKEEFHQQITTQKAQFKAVANITDSQLHMAGKVLTYLGDFCAKHRIYKPLFTAWEKIKETGIVLQEKTLSTYLYVLSSIDDDDDETSFVNDKIQQEVATAHDLLYHPTEKTISLRIKSFVSSGNTQGAESMLNVFQRNHSLNNDTIQNDSHLPTKKKKKDKTRANLGQAKLRTFLPVLESYCKQGDMAAALRLYKKMRTFPSVLLDAETYTTLVSAVAENGYFTKNAKPIEGAYDLGYVHYQCGPNFFDCLISEMAEDVLEISDSCATQIRNAFVRGFKHLESAKDLQAVPSDCTMAPVKEVAASNTLVVCRVSVNDTSAICPRTEARLRLIHLQKDQRQHMHDTLLKMADTQFEAYDAKLEAKNNKKKNNNNTPMNKLDADFAGNELRRFAQWLDEREGDPFTAIIDGANVAYFGLGKVNVFQIRMMVRALEYMGETPLVVLPQKYAQEKFYIRQGYVQSLSSEELEIIQNLTESGQLYIVPQRCLDDYYWMLASVSNQTTSLKGMQLDIDLNNELGRWPGLRPMLITNDRMRDHKLELLEPRLFRRWYGSHIIKYNFSAFIEDTSEERDITFSTADFFSREIQGNQVKNDPQSEMEMVWHIPVNDWEANDRLCIRIPK